MLAAGNRLTRAEDFRRALRRGRRSGGRLMVVHWLDEPTSTQVRAGFVVSRAVGPAVIRNQVKRRLRALVRARLARLGTPGLLVVRALPPAAAASYAELGAELDVRLARCQQGAEVSR